jgi:hypothetical protein
VGCWEEEDAMSAFGGLFNAAIEDANLLVLFIPSRRMRPQPRDVSNQLPS